MQTAIVTGAASGIGKACARKFIAEGWNVTLADIDIDQLSALERDLQSAGGTCQLVIADVTSGKDLQQAVEITRTEWGRVDSLIANAGVQVGGGLLETNVDEWQRIFDVNLNGVALSCQSVLPTMRSQGSGSIVIVSSINALIGSKQMAAYDMSKAGVLALMRNIAVEFGRDGIRANAICPGNTITDHHINSLAQQGLGVDDIRAAMSDYGALGRAAEPEEIASAIYFLGSDAASFVTGHALVADGGFSIRSGAD